MTDIKLPREFIKYNSQFICVSIVGDFYVYRREHLQYKYIHYEIVRPVKFKDEWKYPSASFFGIYGWAFKTEVETARKLDKLLKQQEQKQNEQNEQQ